MQTILVATDLSPRADRAVRRAFRLARRHGAAVHVVYVLDHGLPEAMVTKVDAEARRLLDRFCADAAGPDGPAYTVHISHGDPSTDVHDLARAVGAELMVLGTHHRRPVLDIFRETTLERLVRLSHRPVLVVRDPADHDYANALVAMDFSPASAQAATLAQTVCPGAEIDGFHAVHVPFQGFTTPEGHSEDARFYLGEAQAELAAWARREGTAEVAARTEVVEGALHQVLAQQLAAKKPDLLALGAHGRSGKAPFLLGSFANDMMRETPCDLLIVRP